MKQSDKVFLALVLATALVLGWSLPSLIRPAFAATSAALVTTEVLVLNSAATLVLSATPGRRAAEIFNNGPNTIWCAGTSATAVLTKSRPIAASGSWAVDLDRTSTVYCRAATADQVTGGGTVTNEVIGN